MKAGNLNLEIKIQLLLSSNLKAKFQLIKLPQRRATKPLNNIKTVHRMNEENLLKFLNTYNYAYIKNDQLISIELDKNHRVLVEFKSDGQIEITDKLIGWNFLTGMREKPLKGAIKTQLILAAFGPFVMLGAYYLKLDFIFILIWSILLITSYWYVFIFFVFYNTQLENFKTRIMSLSD